jgi:hypothetical protein
MRKISTLAATLATLATLATAAACWMAPSADASPTWLAPQDLFSTPVISLVPDHFFNNQAALDVASDAAGDSVAVWIQVTGTGSTCQAKWSARPAGGGWSAPADLSGSMNVCEANGTPIAVAMDGSGTAVAAWQFNDPSSGNRPRVQTATRPPGGTFGAAETISEQASSYSVSPDVAVNDAGAAVVGWEGCSPCSSFHARVRPAGAAGFGPIETVAESGEPDAYVPHVAIDGAGDVVAAYVNYHVSVSVPIVEYAYRPANGSFSTATPHDFDAGLDMSGTGQPGQPGTYTPELAIDPAGDATAVWPFWNGTKQSIESAALQAGSASFGAAGAVNPADSGNAGAPQVALDPSSDTAVAVWSQCEGTSNCVVRGAARSSGASFGAAATLSGPAGIGTFGPLVALAPSGTATAIWGGPFSGSPPDRVQVTSRPAGVGQAFGAVDPISGTPLTGVNDDSPAIAFDGEGDAVAVWEHTIGASPGVTVQYAGLDGAAPQIRSLSAPDGLAGQSIAMSAAATDDWSTPNLVWSFGDGQAGAGASVTHTYAHPGSYAVTVSATDAVGNQSAAGATVSVGCPPPPEGTRLGCAPTAAPTPASTPRVSFKLAFKAKRRTGGSLQFSSLTVTKLTSGAALILTCAGGKAKGCPFARKRLKASHKKSIELAGYLPGALKPKAVVEILATKSGYIGDAAELKVEQGKAKLGFLCLPAGGAKPRKTCPG